jgi:hypothetical protein
MRALAGELTAEFDHFEIGPRRWDANHLDPAAPDDATVLAEQLHRVHVDVAASDGIVGELLHGEIVAAEDDLTRLTGARVHESPETDGARRWHTRLGPTTLHDRLGGVGVDGVDGTDRTLESDDLELVVRRP